MYDYGARYYDPVLGRWHSQDPLIAYASPYNGIGNNPVNMIDRWGMCPNSNEGGGMGSSGGYGGCGNSWSIGFNGGYSSYDVISNSFGSYNGFAYTSVDDMVHYAETQEGGKATFSNGEPKILPCLGYYWVTIPIQNNSKEIGTFTTNDNQVVPLLPEVSVENVKVYYYSKQEAESSGEGEKHTIWSWIYKNVLDDYALEGRSDPANMGTTDYHWNSKDMKNTRAILSIYFTGGVTLLAESSVVKILGYLSMINNVDNLTGLSNVIDNQNVQLSITYYKAAVDATNLVFGGAGVIRDPGDFYNTPAFLLDAGSFSDFVKSLNE